MTNGGGVGWSSELTPEDTPAACPGTTLESKTLVRFGRALRKARINAGLTQKQLADITGQARSYISEIEGGTLNISFVSAAKLASAVGLELHDMLKPPPKRR